MCNIQKKLIVTALILTSIYSLSGCSNEKTTLPNETNTLDLTSTTQLVGKVTSVYGNSVTLQVGELNIRTASSVIEADPTLNLDSSVESKNTAGVNGGDMTGTVGNATMADRTQTQDGTTDRTQTQGGTTDRTQMQGGTTDRTQTQGGTTDRTQTQGGTTDRTQMQGGTTDRTQTQGGTTDRTQMQGGNTDSVQMQGSGNSTIDYSEYIVLSDEEINFTIPVGTLVSQNNMDLTFSYIAAEQYLNLYYDTDGILIAVAIIA